jgi:hypothetical protein
MNAQLKTRTAAVQKSPALSPDRVGQAVEASTPRQPAPQASSVSTFEQEIDVFLPIPPKRIVPVTVVVIGRSKAEPHPILDL